MVVNSNVKYMMWVAMVLVYRRINIWCRMLYANRQLLYGKGPSKMVTNPIQFFKCYKWKFDTYTIIWQWK